MRNSMVNIRSWHLVMAIAALIVGGCVSVNLSQVGSHVHRAHVHYSAPGSPFVRFDQKNSDAAWHDPQNGNSIAYFSSCNGPTDPPLSTLRSQLLQGIDHVKVLREKRFMYNERAALRTIAVGDVDGVGAKMETLVFKKNSCLYGLSYVSLLKNFASDENAFNQFVNGFEAP